MNRALFRWHRRIGITSALFVLVLAVTGLLLLLAQPLGLDQKTIGGGLVAKSYNQVPKTEPMGHQLGDDIWVVMVDGLVYVGAASPIALPPPLIGASKTDDGLIAFSNGAQTVITRRDGTLVERYADSAFQKSRAGALPNDVRDKVLARYSGRGMPASRVLLDIHTGRFFGKAGPWVMGLASALLILLSLSGIVMWSSAGQRRRRRERLQKLATNSKNG